MKKNWQQSLISSPWPFILIVFIAAALLAAIVFPEFLVLRNIEFSLNNFFVDYWGAFTLTNFFYQGGIQLWDAYDQIPLCYYYLTLGVFKIFTIPVALIFILFSHLSSFQAEFFQHVYSVGFFLSNLFIKIIGSYLLFKKFSSNRLIPALASVYFSVMCSAVPFVTGGLSFFSYIPLLVYFTLNVFEYRRLRDILCWALFFAVLISDHLLHALYLYQGIHFMVLACIVWSATSRGKGIYRKVLTDDNAIRKVILTSAAYILMLLPIVYMLIFQMGDVDYSTHSRIAKLWDWHYYFTRDMMCNASSLTQFLSALILHNSSYISCGFGVFAFGFFGLLMSKDSRKYIILTAIVFMWLLNQPRDHLFGFVAHAINFLTNPLSFAVRDFLEFQAYFLPVWLISLAVIGVEAFRVYLSSLSQRLSLNRWLIFEGCMLLILAVIMPSISAPERIYCLVQFILLTAFGYSFFFDQKRLSLGVALLAFFIFIEAAAMFGFDRNHTIEPYRPQFHLVDGWPQLGLVGINYQNPRILPYREYFDLSEYHDETNPFFSSKVFGLPGMFYRFTNFNIQFSPVTEIRPRHQAYASWSSDGGEMREYLSKDLHLIFSADAAVKCSDSAFRAIVARGLQRRVAMVCDEDNRLDLPDNIRLPPAASDNPPLYSVLNFDTDHYFVKDGLAYGQILVRKDLWPQNYATTFLTKDQEYLQFYIRGKDGLRKLTQAQGQIVRPDTFDLNNIREGYFTAAFSPQEFPLGEAYVLTQTAKPEGVLKVTRWQSDNLGFDYSTSRDRWLVFHYPYDKKWEITVDHRREKLYRVNKSFIGLPISKGEHQVLLQYWPHSPLRWMLLVSMILSVMILFALIHMALYDRILEGSGS